jgi:hypothetical protein
MPALIPYNYMPTVGARGAFTTVTDGVVQGTFMDDPAGRWYLRAGVLDQAETIPMWGGIGVYENIPTPGGSPDEHLGNILGRATTLTGTAVKGLSGFSMFNQAHNMAVTPQSPVPLSGSGMSVHYIRLGDGVRICVAADPALAALEGGVVGQQVSWDFNAQLLQPFDAATPTYAITSLVWAATAGGRITVVGAVPVTPVTAVGDAVTFSGATNTGTGGAAAINKTFYVDTFTDNAHFTVAAPAAAGVYGTLAGTILANFGVGALTCRVDRILPAGNMVVRYDPITGFATWNYNGCAAIITI